MRAMTTELTAYQSVRDPAQFIESMGKAIANSRMFNCENEAQGKVFALACMANRCDPLSIPQSYHLMHGKLSLRADAMLGRLSKAGGCYEIRERTPHAAEIHVEYKGRSLTERLTWEDAQEEPFVYAGKPADILKKLLGGDRSKLQLSTNYATPRRRGQHLWARVVSDSVRAVAPELVTGVYSPDETHGILVDQGRVSPSAPMVEQEVEEELPPPADVSAQGIADAEDAEFAPTPSPDDDASKASGDQIRRITELFAALGVPGDSQLAAIKKRGASDMGNLSPDGASDLIKSLEGVLASQNDQVAGQSKADPKATESKLSGPVDANTVNELRNLLQQASQWQGGADLGSRVKQKLESSGLQQLADLSIADADRLKEAIAAKNIELFFAASIEGHQKAKEGND